MSTKTKASELKLDYKNTFLIGFGFFASSLAWSVYNANVPLILDKYVSSTFLLGIIMAIDNIFAVIFQPLFGALSDKTVTKRGRRLPYILVGIPICAILFNFIPWTKSLYALMGLVIIFNFIMSTWRSPVIALMPDVTPSPLRSKANGVINLMGGVGGVLAFLVGGILLDIGGMKAPFMFCSIVMIVAWLLLYFFVHEPIIMCKEERIKLEQKEKIEELSDKKSINKSLLCILLAIFFWFVGYNAIETYFTLYATNVLNITPGIASITLTFFSLALVIGAIPAGIIGTKLGRKKTIITGLIGIILIFSVQIMINDINIIRVLLALAGFFWACVNINSLPMVLEIAKSSRIGKYTGYYYFFSASAAIISPPLFGLIHDFTNNYSHLFVYSVIAFILALICISMAKHGEAVIIQDEITKEIEEFDN
ncbi:SLC45 family MFS transporter [Sedimentibacter sp. zth1]|uniref:MFS transporter n=1 Tax=Sedimentibacter sp. zth1 TaxID=2816908 RepID=UPI001A92B50B|nr:MFS transporter [Sedimentibacter sp. zth1]QSX04693.1 SLC45 family MFS transporter [Sedimentibacter sp. zth1]